MCTLSQTNAFHSKSIACKNPLFLGKKFALGRSRVVWHYEVDYDTNNDRGYAFDDLRITMLDIGVKILHGKLGLTNNHLQPRIPCALWLCQYVLLFIQTLYAGLCERRNFIDGGDRFAPQSSRGMTKEYLPVHIISNDTSQ